jgi:hypothetical protein
MRVHSYEAGEPVQTHEVGPETRLRELLAVETEERAYPVDGTEELDVELTVAELFGDEPGHVLVHRCHSVAVKIEYAGVETTLKVHPSTRLRRVRDNAAKELGIAPADVAGSQLRLPESTVDLNLTEPVGAFTSHGECTVTFDLVHAKRPQG